ncbi:MAG: hypothetical protein GY950_30050 [bacterium]|nr:hypothetical protein [bacterium]
MRKKLNLGTIKVQSFVTSLKNEEKTKIKGGLSLGSMCCPDDQTGPPACGLGGTLLEDTCGCESHHCISLPGC